jgi:hypothetical protein
MFYTFGSNVAMQCWRRFYSGDESSRAIRTRAVRTLDTITEGVKEIMQRSTSWLGKRSYKARLKRLGIERIREIARQNGKKGGRPPKKGREENTMSVFKRGGVYWYEFCFGGCESSGCGFGQVA